MEFVDTNILCQYLAICTGCQSVSGLKSKFVLIFKALNSLNLWMGDSVSLFNNIKVFFPKLNFISNNLFDFFIKAENLHAF